MAGGGALVVAVAWLIFYLLAIRGGTIHNEIRNDEPRQYLVNPNALWNNQEHSEQKFNDMTFVFSDDDHDGDPTAFRSWHSESAVASVNPVGRAAEQQRAAAGKD